MVQAIGHLGKIVAGALKVGDANRQAWAGLRARIRLNSPATHLMRGVARCAQDPHVAQKGSLVSDKSAASTSHDDEAVGKFVRLRNLVVRKFAATCRLKREHHGISTRRGARAMAVGEI